LYRRLRPRQRRGYLFPFLVKLRQLWIERPDLILDLADLQVVILESQQRLNFLLHQPSASRSSPALLPFLALGLPVVHRALVGLNFLKYLRPVALSSFLMASFSA